MFRFLITILFVSCATMFIQGQSAYAHSPLCANGFPLITSIPDEFDNYPDQINAPLHWQTQRVYFSSDESRMFVSKEHQRIRIYETTNWERVGEIITSADIARTAFSGDRLALGMQNGAYQVYNLNGELIFSNEIENSESVNHIQLSPSGRYLIVSTGSYDTSFTRVFDLNTAEQIYSDNSPFNTNFMQNQGSFIFSEDEQFLIHVVWSFVDPTLLVKNLVLGTAYSATFPKEQSPNNHIDQVWVQPGTGKLILRVESSYYEENVGDFRLHSTALFDPATGEFSSIVKTTNNTIYSMGYDSADPTNLWVLNQETYSSQEPIAFYKLNFETGEKSNLRALPDNAFEKIARPFDDFSIVANGRAMLFYDSYVYDVNSGTGVGFIFGSAEPILGKSRRFAASNPPYIALSKTNVADISCLQR